MSYLWFLYPKIIWGIQMEMLGFGLKNSKDKVRNGK